MEYGLSRGYTRVDQIQAGILNGEKVLVEAKYSTSGYPSLSRAQRLAQTELPEQGLDYRIITTVPGEVEAAGHISGSVGGGAVGSAAATIGSSGK